MEKNTKRLCDFKRFLHFYFNFYWKSLQWIKEEKPDIKFSIFQGWDKVNVFQTFVGYEAGWEAWINHCISVQICDVDIWMFWFDRPVNNKNGQPIIHQHIRKRIAKGARFVRACAEPNARYDQSRKRFACMNLSFLKWIRWSFQTLPFFSMHYFKFAIFFGFSPSHGRSMAIFRGGGTFCENFQKIY